MTQNEKDFFTANRESDNVFLYRVYNYDEITRTGDIWIITPKELLDNFVFNPITFKVEIKEAFKR